MKKIFVYLSVLAVIFTVACNKPKEDPQTLFITYPATGEYGANILSDEVTTMIMADHYGYSMHTEVPEGLSLKIVVKSDNQCITLYTESEFNNWKLKDNDNWTWLREFTVIESGKPSDLKVSVMDNYSTVPCLPDDKYITIEYYENGATTPTKIRNIYIIAQIVNSK